MAEAQLVAARDSDATTRASAENEIRVKAAALRVVDALEQLGLAGKKAGEGVAAGAGQASDALEDTVAAADKAASSAEQLGQSSNNAASGLESVVDQAQRAGENAFGAIEDFANAATNFNGNLDLVTFNLLTEETRQAGMLLETPRAQNAERAAGVDLARRQFRLIGDSLAEQLNRETEISSKRRTVTLRTGSAGPSSKTSRAAPARAGSRAWKLCTL